MIYRIVSMLTITFIIVVTGMFSGPAIGGQTTDTISLSASSDRTFEGLLAVKEADGEFIVRSEAGKKKRFKLSQNTMVIRNGKPVAYSDLQSRDQVSVRYNSDFVVIEIQASGP